MTRVDESAEVGACSGISLTCLHGRALMSAATPWKACVQRIGVCCFAQSWWPATSAAVCPEPMVWKAEGLVASQAAVH